MRQSHQSPNPLLITKLHIPHPRRNLVPRPGLIERLNQVLTCKLTLIAAPAGFGKTTLLSQWLSERMNASREGGRIKVAGLSDQFHPSSLILQPSQVAWVSLDKNDNDPTWFWTYLIAALETVQTGLSENVQVWLDSPQLPIEANLTPLINALTIIPDDFVLVLDDYDVIEAQPIHAALNFLLDHIPPNLHLVIGAFDAVEPPLREAELALNRQADEAPLEARHARAEIDAIRATVAITQGKIAQGTELVHRSLQKLPDDSPLLRSVLAYSLGMAHRSRGDTHAARQAFAEAQSLSEADDSLLTALLAIHNLAGLQIEEGRLHQAVELYQHALDLVEHITGDQTLPIAGTAHVGLGKVLLEWNELDAAQQHLEKSIELAKQEGGLGAASEGYIALAFLYQAQGDEARALRATQQAEEYFGYSPYPNAAAILSDFRARLALAQGDLAAAQHWAHAHQLHIEDKLSYENKRRYLSLARLLMAQKQFEAAQKLLTRLRQLAEAAGWMSSLIETLLLQALTYQAQRKTSEAIMALQHALSLAEPEGYIRIFVVEGEPMRLLLAHCRVQIADQSPRLGSYLDKLLSAFQPGSEAASLPASSPPLLIEPLSERELEVLRLMASGASNQAIAEELTIALTTAKKHVSNIIGKLGVSNRTQVVTRVHDLGLL